MAYAELEREGRVTSRVGRGTVVVSPVEEGQTRTRHDRLMSAVEHSLEAALSLGFTLDEYAETVHRYLREKREMLNRIRLVFVECNREQLSFYSENLALDTGVEIIPLLLTDIREKPAEFLPRLREADIVLTSFYHVDELEELLGDEGPPLVGISSEPAMSTIIEIARIPPTARIGCVTFSNTFMSEIETVLSRMQIDRARVAHFSERDGEKLREFGRSDDAVIVSPPRRPDVDEVIDDADKRIEFMLVPDRGSINNLRLALLELKEQKEETGNSVESVPPDTPEGARHDR
jgi:GntR family transcriptional regulator